MRGAAGFADRFVAERDEFVVKGRGSMCQRRSHETVTLPSAAKRSLASLASCEHARKRLGVEMALVESDAAFLDDAGDDARLRGAGADGADAAVRSAMR